MPDENLGKNLILVEGSGDGIYRIESHLQKGRGVETMWFLRKHGQTLAFWTLLVSCCTSGAGSDKIEPLPPPSHKKAVRSDESEACFDFFDSDSTAERTSFSNLRAARTSSSYLKGGRTSFSYSTADRVSQLFDSSVGWKIVTAPSLGGHIVNAHFQARTLCSYGIAQWDIEIAQYRGFNLNWVVQKAYERLERSDGEILAEIRDHAVMDRFTVQDYRLTLVKNLKFIESRNLAPIDWNRVELSFPGARNITVDLKEDSRDGSFFDNLHYYLL